MKMRRFRWLIIAIVGFGVSIAFVFALRQPDSARAPQITFDERVYDFGVVEPEDTPQHRFT